MAKVLDGRRNNGGRSTKGYAGRKPLVIEQNVKAAILRAARKDKKALDEIWQKIFERCKQGSEKHIRILFDYFYGRPLETVKVEQKSMSLHVIQTIVTTDANTGSTDKPAIQSETDRVILPEG